MGNVGLKGTYVDLTRKIKFVLKPGQAAKGLIGLVILAVLIYGVIHLLPYRSVGSCRKALASGKISSKWKAARALASDFEADEIKDAVPELIKIVEQQSTDGLSDLCADVLGRLNNDAKEVVLHKLIRDAESQVQVSSNTGLPRAIAKIGEPAVPNLCAWLKDDSRKDLQSLAVRAFDVMERLPESPEDRAWLFACRGQWANVIELGAPAFPVIHAKFSANQGEERFSHIWVWGDFDGISVNDMVRGGMNDGLLAALQTSGERAIPILLDLIARHSNPKVRWCSIALLHYGFQAHWGEGPLALDTSRYSQAISSTLMAALDDNDLAVRRIAAAALTAIARFDRAAFDACISSLHQGGPEVRKSVITALGGTGDKDAVRALIETLNDPDAEVRLRGAAALWMCGAFANLVFNDSASRKMTRPVRYLIVPEVEGLDVTSSLPERVRAMSYAASNVLVLVDRSQSINPDWVWAPGGGGATVYNVRPAYDANVRIRLIDKDMIVYREFSIRIGIVDYVSDWSTPNYSPSPGVKEEIVKRLTEWASQHDGS